MAVDLCPAHLAEGRRRAIKPRALSAVVTEVRIYQGLRVPSDWIIMNNE